MRYADERPPGAGKTLIARSMPGILPQMSVEEALDVTRIYSLADQLSPDEPAGDAYPAPQCQSRHL